ncbi:MAG: Unknown protein [uncultured Sulfurovum sp.]|uniref:Uncharacterized protein n=1 Tax=uncultured Sulfurovum sp. TaxID=269237 RepID=A0A6S6UET8_9BACT|nr:MAG: Unknown protein [uncultured Sulfurovum sp.]
MSNKQYVTITHYKEREFFFLNHAIQTNDGFITKDIEQFHESEKEKFIERIRELQAQYPTNQVVSLSLAANQVVKEKEDPTQASAKIFKENYVMQEKIDIGNIPVTLYFSPYSILYEEYKHKLDEKLTLMIGLFDRKLYIMFATKDKIHQSWTLGTRGLTEKQIADRVYKSMKAYYKISFKFADQIEMLVSDDSPKLLKVLREELSMSILPTQKTIHTLLHHMGAEQRRFSSSYIKSFISTNKEKAHRQANPSTEQTNNAHTEDIGLHSLDDIRLNSTQETNMGTQTQVSFFDKLKSAFSTPKSTQTENKSSIGLLSFIPLAFVLMAGAYFTIQEKSIENKLALVEAQTYAQTNNVLLSMNSQDIFASMGKSADLKFAKISNEKIEIKGVVWGIEPLRNALTELYNDGEFVIKPLENFMTEFSFKSKV